MGREDSLIALPMHGEVKLRREGYRTRDGHVLEWIERLRPELDVTVRSRPEPFPRVSLARRHGRISPTWEWQSPQPLALPSPRARRRWWVDSLAHEPSAPVESGAVLAWNPIAAARLVGATIRTDRFVIDLLDDWSIHVALQPIRKEVEAAYRRVFELADAITANSEGTVALAARFGREAELLPNGCDPERFAAPGDRRADGPVVVGYAGKLSERLDVELIASVASDLPEVRFEICGPYATASAEAARAIRALDRIDNVTLAGDVPYAELPTRIASWDVGWVPHRVGRDEVGGDAMKTYEYRAAGLPVVSTPIIGADRLPGVTVAEGAPGARDALEQILRSAAPARPPRVPLEADPTWTWRHKTERILELLDL